MCLPISLTDFFTLSPIQTQQFQIIETLYRDWNSKLNLISRKDIENLFLHHILHSLSIARLINFSADTTILDVGTGGGFPGIPLAILFPNCKFTLIDSIEKKIKATEDIVKNLELKNTCCKRIRAEEEKGKYDFIISRATMSMTDLFKICRKNISTKSFNAMPNGFIVLKGGNIHQEINKFKNIAETFPIIKYFNNPWFENKYLLYLPC